MIVKIISTFVILLNIITNIQCSLIFELRPGARRCYIDELFENSVLMIKWKIFKEDGSKEVDNLLPGINIVVTSEETKKKIYEFTPTERKGKTTFSPKKEGAYRICSFYKGRLPQGEKLFMNLKFGSDNMDEPKLADAVKSGDISKIEVKTDDLIAMAKPIIAREKKLVERENFSSKRTLYTTRWYKRITYIQIILCVVIGIVQLNNFRKFLKSQNII